MEEMCAARQGRSQRELSRQMQRLGRRFLI